MQVGAEVSKVLYNRIFAPIRKFEVDERSIKEGLELFNRFLPIVDTQLNKNKYIARNGLTLADLNLLEALDSVEMVEIDIDHYVNVVGWRIDLRKEEFYTKCHKEYGESFKLTSRS